MLFPIQPTRGLIFDRNGVLLAKDIPTYILVIIYDNNAKDLSEIIKQLKKLTQFLIKR